MFLMLSSRYEYCNVVSKVLVGSLTFNTESGNGTEFIIFLPLQESEQTSDNEEQA